MMNKKTMLLSGCTVVMATVLLASCGNKKAQENDNSEAVKAAEELVEVVESQGSGINNTPYNAEFFDNDANQGATATDSTYAVTPSGLKYVIINEGSGKAPVSTDNVTVNYVGTFTNGTQFDSSLDRGEPATFPLNAVIPGWTEGLQLMKEGGTAVFYLPYQLAYGERGVQNLYTGEYQIPPSTPLMFWVELIQVN